MAEARQGIKIAEPLNRYMRKVFESKLGLEPRGLEVLGQSVRAIEEVIGNINESSGFFVSHGVLVERLRAVEHDLDERLAARELEETRGTQVTAAMDEV
jgi:hypothetical protein